MNLLLQYATSEIFAGFVNTHLTFIGLAQINLTKETEDCSYISFSNKLLNFKKGF